MKIILFFMKLISAGAFSNSVSIFIIIWICSHQAQEIPGLSCIAKPEVNRNYLYFLSGNTSAILTVVKKYSQWNDFEYYTRCVRKHVSWETALYELRSTLSKDYFLIFSFPSSFTVAYHCLPILTCLMQP